MWKIKYILAIKNYNYYVIQNYKIIKACLCIMPYKLWTVTTMNLTLERKFQNNTIFKEHND